MEYQTAPHGSLGLPYGLYQFMSHTEGTALLFESEWVPQLSICPHLTFPIGSIHYIKKTEKKLKKPLEFKKLVELAMK